ncbi:Ribosomal RNA-processing protein 17 [Grifola frondosa]|uniref:Ribosomal RNA-processing protein 17 n=1 Tax=Grifola frondosa TaxID=5627 RepID=A0A1C7LRF1_GRIFR|nr:Ribosomal RNA-processing protein 17 [Grifola frondosa]
MANSNLAILTKSHNIIAAKKRAKREQIKEIVFDDGARREFLTGFHKRNLKKKEDAKKKAIEREKQERLEARREQRKLLAQRAAQNAAETERAYGGLVDDREYDDEWSGLSRSCSSQKGKGREIEMEEEYEDEEQLATVTVVEDFDPDALIHGPDRTRKAGEIPQALSESSIHSQQSDPAMKVRSGDRPSGQHIEGKAERAKLKAKTAVKAKV